MRWAGRVNQYSQQQMGASGFVIAHSRVAYMLRPDIWPQPVPCSTDFGVSAEAIPFELSALVRREGHLFTVSILGLCENAPGVARSKTDLARRIEYLTGIQPTKITFYETVEALRRALRQAA